jgi:acyl-CoA hydrolase
MVAEYGIAYLFGKAIRERAVALIEVAHPRWHDELLAMAKQLGYIPREQYISPPRRPTPCTRSARST